MAQIEKVISKQTPTLLNASKANELIGFVNGLLASKGDNSIDVTVEGSGRLVVSLKEGLSGVPDGFEETSVILCVDGSPVSGSILFKADQTD